MNIVDHLDSLAPSVHRIPGGQENSSAIRVHAGVAYSPDGTLLYDATGDDGCVAIYDTSNWKQLFSVALNGLTQGGNFKDSFAATLVLSRDGRTLYVLDQGNWRVVLIDTTSHTRLAYVPTGVNPFTLALSPDGHRLYVANSGLFEYQRIPGIERKHLLATALHFPPFANLSKDALHGTFSEGHSIPALGDPNALRGSSLWTYDIADRAHPAFTAKLRLGAPITGADNGVVGGASPSGIAVGARHVYISLAHEDAVAVASIDGVRLHHTIPL